MTKYFKSLRPVVMEMKQAEYVIYPRWVTYKKQKYSMTIIRFTGNEKHDQYDICTLLFIDKDHFERRLEARVNDFRIQARATDLIDFFNIEQSSGLGNMFRNLYSSLRDQLPSHFYKIQSDLVQTAKDILNEKSPQNEQDKFYGFSIMRLGKDQYGKQRHRSAFNAQKTQMWYPMVYKLIKKDPTLSVCPQRIRQNVNQTKNCTKSLLIKKEYQILKIIL